MKKIFESFLIAIIVIAVIVGVFVGLTYSNGSDELVFPPQGRSYESAYSGYWKALDVQGDVFYIYLKKDGKCYSSWSLGEVGKWTVKGERAEMHWTDGWIEWIYFEKGDFKKLAFAPTTPLFYKATTVNFIEKIHLDEMPKGALEKIEQMEKEKINPSK